MEADCFHHHYYLMFNDIQLHSLPQDSHTVGVDIVVAHQPEVIFC